MSATKNYKICEHIIDFDLLTITTDGQVSKVEPRLMAVLSYFIDHPSELISRDRLIEQVWQGAVVSDNAVNRTITQLRKQLGDSAQNPQIIETIPKKGYRFIAHAEAISASKTLESNHQQDTTTKAGSRLNPLILITAALVASLCLIILKLDWVLTDKTIRYDFKQLSYAPVTSLPGLEAYPDVSSDGELLVFSHQSSLQSPWQIIATPLNASLSEQKVHSLLLESSSLLLSPSWSTDNQYIAYVRWNNSNERKCSIHLLTVNRDSEGLSAASDKKLFDCGTRSLPHISWLNDRNAFIYTDRASLNEPYTAFLYRTDTAQKTQLTLPPQSELGHFWVEASPDGNGFAILNYVDETETEVLFYQQSRQIGSAQESSLVTKRNLKFRITRTKWLDPETLLLYANGNLLTLSKSGAVQQFEQKNNARFGQLEVSTSTRKVFAVEFINQQNIWRKDLVSAAQKQSDQTTKVSTETAFISSSRQDFSPRFAHLSNQVAFFSNRSGKLQIWLRKPSGELQQITHFVGGIDFSPIRWSHDDNYLLFKHNKVLYRMALDSMSLEKLLEASFGAYNYAFSSSPEDIIVSSKKSGDWQLWRVVFSKNLEKQNEYQLTQQGGYGPRISKDGKFVYYTKFHQDGLWRQSLVSSQRELIDNSNLQKNSLGANNEELINADIDKLNWLHWQLTAEGAYIIDVKSPKPGVYFLDFASGEKRLVLEKAAGQSNDFSISSDNKEIIFSRVDAQESDIYQSTY